MSHKLVMSSLVAFFPRDASMPVATAVAAFYAMVLLLKDPYIRRWDDTLAHLAQVELFLFCSASYVLYSNPDLQNDPSVNVVLSMALIALTLAVVIGFLLAASYSLRLWYVKTRRNAIAAKIQAKLDATSKKDGDSQTGATDTDTDKDQDPASTGIVQPAVVGDYNNQQRAEDSASLLEVVRFLLRRKPKSDKDKDKSSKDKSKPEQEQKLEVDPDSPRSPTQSPSSPSPAAEGVSSAQVELTPMSTQAHTPAEAAQS